MKSFGQLRNNFLLPKTDFFRYLQLRHLLTAQTDWAKIANPTGSEQFLMHLQSGNDETKVISRFYQQFLLLNPNNSVQIKQRWEAEMHQEVSMENWDIICSEAQLVTGSNTWREFKWKVFARYFRTHIVAKMGPTHNNKCWRSCGVHIGIHLHIFWACPKLRSFWDEVYKVLAVVFHANIPKDPLLYWG